jgi:hypothetical protein
MLRICLIAAAAALMLQGCLAASVAGATVGAAGTVVGAAAKGTAAVGRAVIPGDGDHDKGR